MRIAVLYNAVPPSAAGEDLDLLIQLESVNASLANLGHDAFPVEFTPGSPDPLQLLRRTKPSLVFNLVESVDGDNSRIHQAPQALDGLGLPYTGSRTDAMFLTTDKVLAKKSMIAAGIDTPRFVTADRGEEAGWFEPGCYIIKPVAEDASVGLDDNPVAVCENVAELLGHIESRSRATGCPCFAEAYIDGREFNISLLDRPGGPQVLPPAEILFDHYPPDKLKIVDYRAKWDRDSFEYHHTPRCFDFTGEDLEITTRLKSTALACWKLFGLGGYARVDFRVDNTGRAWVLEINANPCLSPDSGLVASSERAGIDFNTLIDRIINNPVRRFETN
ncbi:D-alanine--D-alanine ligase [candidate division KSB1 bacterium]